MKISFYINFIFTLITCLSNTQNEYLLIDLKDSKNKEILPEFNQTIALEIAFGLESNNIFFNQIIDAISIGKQIKSSIISNNINKKNLYLELAEKNIQFYIYLYTKNNTLIWKLYSVFDQKFIKGKSYHYTENSMPLLRTIAIDIWQELFGDIITPYNSFLTYLNTSFNNHIQESCIEFCHPLLSNFEKTIFKLNQNILDLNFIDSKPLQSLLFSTQGKYGTSIMKLNSHGNIIKILEANNMLISPTVNQDGLFYINSGFLYRYYYHKEKKQFISELLDKNNDFVSVYAILNSHEILVSKNKKIFKVSYQINHNNNELILLQAEKITESSFHSLSMTYDYNDNRIIVSQKINGYYQLVAYSNKQKKIITKSNYHKQDPSISPCGNYIAYVAQTKDGDRYIEVINKYSNEVIRVTNLPGEYRFPTWLIR